MDSQDSLIEANRTLHDKLAATYDEHHDEIFNPTEQRRVEKLIRKGLDSVRSAQAQVRALDFGAGTGNLTRHMLDQGAHVTSADVSPGILAVLKAKYGDRVETALLNGQDLREFGDNTFDFAATYSVLHHIPDYLAAVSELVRVTRHGGVILLDHEASPSRWTIEKDYMDYLRALGPEFVSGYLYQMEALHLEPARSRLTRRLRRLTSLRAWRGYLRRRLQPAKYKVTEAGDIHVFKSQHIEWDRIREAVAPQCEIIDEQNYLVCREQSDPPEVWQRYCGSLDDMRYMMLRKKGGADGS